MECAGGHIVCLHLDYINSEARESLTIGSIALVKTLSSQIRRIGLFLLSSGNDMIKHNPIVNATYDVLQSMRLRNYRQTSESDSIALHRAAKGRLELRQFGKRGTQLGRKRSGSAR